MLATGAYIDNARVAVDGCSAPCRFLVYSILISPLLDVLMGAHLCTGAPRSWADALISVKLPHVNSIMALVLCQMLPELSDKIRTPYIDR